MKKLANINMYLNTYSVSRSGHNFVASVIKSWFPDEIVEINSHENYIISEIKQNNVKQGPKLLIIRNFLNWVASYHMMVIGLLEKKNVDRYKSVFNNLLKIYKELIEEYVNDKYFFADVKIYYDRFKEDEEYRKEICNTLGGKYTEIAMEFVPAAGQSSSFDKDRFQGRGSQMKTSDRYKQIDKFKEDYLDILRENKDIINRWVEVFGATEEELEFINKL